ncbi:ABC transporter permease [Bradyrhizobium sp. SZCCHNRI3037]|uniref:ABC transporter permease n=1 Tax=Bradyrhizobium sp. SZCCHNRI3037 TaxID=3057290 RepID=UPI0029165491|nr:ABC transporter permease [Bradyrhizobium sp. SZCCHNRI3037]
MTESERLIRDSVKSVRLWRVWTFMGMQDVRVRFRRSLLGPVWILINLSLFVGGAGVVYGLMFGQNLSEFLPFLVTGFIVWGFLLSTMTEAGTAFIVAEGYIKQFSFPKQIYLLRALVNYNVILLFGATVIIVMQAILQNVRLLGWLEAFPGLLILNAAGLGHVVVSAYMGAMFRDWPHALGGLLQILFFVTPIMFPISVLQERGLDLIYQFNPLFYLIDVVRCPIVEGQFAPLEHYGLAILYVMLVWGVAAIVARQLDRRLVYLL